MTNKEKQLLLKDLCARLPYGVKCLVIFNETKYIMTLKTGLPNSYGNWDFYNENCSVCSKNFKPYLRPMSSMTEEEKNEYLKTKKAMYFDTPETYDWLNKNMFDYRGLIERGLAIEAPEGMYNEN